MGINDQHWSDTGTVFFKKGRVEVGACAYDIERVVDERGKRIQGSVALDPAVAARLQRERATMVLQLADGRFVDFIVIGHRVFDFTGTIRVEW